MAQPVDLMVTDVILPEMELSAGGRDRQGATARSGDLHVRVLRAILAGPSPHFVAGINPRQALPFQALLLHATHMTMRRPAAGVPAFVSI
jgi:hypothetical protein